MKPILRLATLLLLMLGLSHLALAEPFACVLRGQQALKIGGDDVGLILGAGPIGVMHVLAARAAGAAKICCTSRAAW